MNCEACGGTGLKYFGRSSEEPPCAQCGGTGLVQPSLLDAARCAQNVLFLLQDEVKALGLRAGNVQDMLRTAIEKASDLASAPPEDNRDAARYRWLRDVSVSPHNFYISVPDEFGDVRYSPQEVDAYIDAAIARATGARA